MATITIPVTDDLYRRMEHFSWVKWSEVARHSLRKRKIFEKYLKHSLTKKHRKSVKLPLATNL
ncbi:hypothetical protein MSLAZ_2859 [Methanosarcina lacustris Z-7289]|uniref:Uncharacterized protein n=1 Tax=Methanosarcina lacustris Z-7289 TaxID=1434111 RepID=A0A0E3WSB9_9EURY|nr:hypothetical protein [Methanosarcina lacustris]AKB76120.1 hypothetical protein MSLAZ_2859 [Methanosarcina lacustris Z-7289]